MKFLELEGAYLVIGIFILIITVFVTTRPFVGKNALKIGFPFVFAMLAFFIGLHYYITTERMNDVQTRFNADKPVICENRIQRKAEQSIIITKELGWSLGKDVFTHPKYTRAFHTARCLQHFTKEFPEPRD